MPNLWHCPECGRENAAEVRFCPQCGTSNPANKPEPAASSRPVVWLALAGIALLAIIIAVGWLMMREAPAAERSAAVTVLPVSPISERQDPTFTPTPVPPENTTPTTAPPPPEPAAAETPAAVEGQPDDAGASAGDTISLPTPDPEGVILFLSSRDHDPQEPAGPTGPGQHRRVELYAMQPDGSQQTRLSDGSQEWGNTFPGLTTYPAANQIVVNGRYVYDLTTGQVVEEVALEFPDSGPTGTFGGQNPVWLSEGVFFYGAKSDERPSIYYLEAGADVPQKLTNPPAGVWGDAWPDLSPDETWIVFFRNWYDPAHDGLWLMRPDGSEAQRIIPGSEGTPHRGFWSPDGAQIAYEGPKPNSDRFNFEVWLADADGSNRRQLTSLPEHTGAWEPKWSPDGQSIVFNGGDSYLGHIYVVDVDGSDLRQLTDIGDANLAPLWLPLSLDDLYVPPPDEIAPTPTPSPTLRPIVIASPTAPVKSPNCPSTGVQITAPAPGSWLTQRYTTFVGTANIVRFHHWKIEYSTNPDGGWSFLMEHDYPVENDELFTLDASTVPAGPYGLRLTVVNQTGNYPEPCEVWYMNSY